MTEVIIIAILSGVFGSIITWFFQYIFKKREENYKSELEIKEKRYKSVIVFMECYLHKKNFKIIQLMHPDIKSQEELKEALKFEYREMLLFAPDNIVKSLKYFIENPNEDKYFRTVQFMRKDLFRKATKLNISDIKFQP